MTGDHFPTTWPTIIAGFVSSLVLLGLASVVTSLHRIEINTRPKE